MKLNLNLSLINELAGIFEYWHWDIDLIKKFISSRMDLVKKFLEGDAQILEEKFIEMRVKRALSYRARMKVKLSNGVCEDGKLTTKMQEAGYVVTGKKMPELLATFKFKTKDVEEEVIIIRLDDLWPIVGWNGNWGLIIERAKSFGLEYCSLELGLQFLLQQAKSLPDEYFTFAMDSIFSVEDSDGFKDHYYLGCKEKRIIPSQRGIWEEGDLWAFKVTDPKKFALR